MSYHRTVLGHQQAQWWLHFFTVSSNTNNFKYCVHICWPDIIQNGRRDPARSCGTFGVSRFQLIIMMTSSNGNIFRDIGPLCGNSPITGEFPSQRPVTRGFDVFFDLLNKRLSKQWWGWWFEMSSRSLWRHCNVMSSTWFPREKTATEMSFLRMFRHCMVASKVVIFLNTSSVSPIRNDLSLKWWPRNLYTEPDLEWFRHHTLGRN